MSTCGESWHIICDDILNDIFLSPIFIDGIESPRIRFVSEVLTAASVYLVADSYLFSNIAVCLNCDNIPAKMPECLSDIRDYDLIVLVDYC